jgi:hypothetical protein
MTYCRLRSAAGLFILPEAGGAVNRLERTDLLPGQKFFALTSEEQISAFLEKGPHRTY